MNKLYSRINWKNYPSEETALNETNLNKMDLALDNLDNRVIEMDATKVNKEVANSLVQSWSMDESTGIITITHLDGSKDMFDLNIEKIPVNFELSKDGILTMTTDDGSKFTANIGAMIPVLTFDDSDEIAVSVSGTGVNKTYSFSIKASSVTEDKLQPNFLADVKTEVAKAQASKEAAAEKASAASGSATLAESYTHGSTGTREGEDTDNARYYMEQAKAVSAVDVATTEKAGIVKPDGTTITVDVDGTLHGNSEVTVDSELSKESENPLQNKTVAEELEKKLNSDGDSKDLTTTFTSQDSTNVTEWTDVGLLTSGEKHSSLFQKVATMFKNIRYLYHMLGTADISTLGEGADIGTVTGALSKLNSDFESVEIGNYSLPEYLPEYFKYGNLVVYKSRNAITIKIWGAEIIKSTNGEILRSNIPVPISNLVGILMPVHMVGNTTVMKNVALIFSDPGDTTISFRLYEICEGIYSVCSYAI